MVCDFAEDAALMKIVLIQTSRLHWQLAWLRNFALSMSLRLTPGAFCTPMKKSDVVRLPPVTVPVTPPLPSWASATPPHASVARPTNQAQRRAACRSRRCPRSLGFIDEGPTLARVPSCKRDAFPNTAE